MTLLISCKNHVKTVRHSSRKVIFSFHFNLTFLVYFTNIKPINSYDGQISQGKKNAQLYRGWNLRNSDFRSNVLPTELSARHCHTFPLLNDILHESQSYPGQLKGLFSYSFMPTDAVLDPHWPPNVTGREKCTAVPGLDLRTSVPTLF